MKKLTTMALALLLTMGISTTSLKAAEGKKLNWAKENNIYYVLDENNEKTIGWIKDDANCWYFLDYKTGAMKTGWVASDATTWYYLGGSGVMQSGWQTLDGNKYYFETSGAKAGAMITGTKEIDGRKYNFDSNGILVGESIKGEPLWSNYENVDKKTKEILAEIIKPNMSEREELRAIHDWVANNTEYGGSGLYGDEKTDLLGEYTGETGKIFSDRYVKVKAFYVDVITNYATGYSVCDGYARVVATLADALGYRTTVIGGSTKDGGHQVAAVWMSNEWKIIDAQIDDSVPGKILDMGFLVSNDDQNYFTARDFFNFKDFNTYATQRAIAWNETTDYIRYNV